MNKHLIWPYMGKHRADGEIRLKDRVCLRQIQLKGRSALTHCCASKCRCKKHILFSWKVWTHACSLANSHMVPFPPLVRSPQFASDHATTPQFARAIDRGERGREAGSPGHAHKGCRSTDDGKVLPREEATHRRRRRLASVRSSIRSSVTKSGRCCVASALCTPLPQSTLSSCWQRVGGVVASSSVAVADDRGRRNPSSQSEKWTGVGPGRSGKRKSPVSSQPGHRIVCGPPQPGSQTEPGNQTHLYCMKWTWSWVGPGNQTHPLSSSCLSCAGSTFPFHVNRDYDWLET
jgi:hypothetical protein